MGRKNNRASDEQVLSRKERRAAKLAAERFAIASNGDVMPSFIRQAAEAGHPVGQLPSGHWYTTILSA